MKKARYISAAFLCILSVSCAKPEPENAGDVICFGTPEVAETKVLIENADQMISGEGELAYSVFASKYVPASDGEMTGHTLFMNNVKVYNSGESDWKYDGSYHWSPGAAHKFFALYPFYDKNKDTYDEGLIYEIDEDKHALKVTKADGRILTGTKVDEGTGKYENICPDILYSTVHYEEAYSILEKRDEVIFNMNHALAAVSFIIRNAKDTEISSVSNVSFSGLHDSAEGLYVSENGAEWGNPSTSDNASFNVPAITDAGLGVGETLEWYTALVIPQDFSKNEIKLSFVVDGTKYNLTLSDYPVGSTAQTRYSYESGMHYKYNFDVTSKAITCTVSIVPWIEDEPIELN